MVDRTLDWAGVTSVKRVVDVGCGIGGSSRHIARRFGPGVAVRGLTLRWGGQKAVCTCPFSYVFECRVQVSGLVHFPASPVVVRGITLGWGGQKAVRDRM